MRAGDGDVGVEIGDGMGEMGSMVFGPLGRAHQALLFGVPAAEDDAALGLPTLL